MLGRRKTLHARYHRTRRRAQGLVRLLFLSVPAMPPAFSRLTTSARCWALAKNRACNCQVNKPAICRARSGCKFTIRRNAGHRRKPPTFPLGQGYTLVSPLQLAMAYVAMANGGTCYYPRLVDKVMNQDGTPVFDEQGNPAAPPPRVRSDLRQEISPTTSSWFAKAFGRLSTKTAAPAAERV